MPPMNIFDRLASGCITESAEQTREIAKELGASLPPDRALAIHGNLGVGKTTFVQGLASGLGIQDPVTSPTFNIFTLYRGAGRTLVHLDAYRLENERQISDLMLEDFLTSPYWLAVEWPSKIIAWLPKNTIDLDLRIIGPGRHSIQLLNPGALRG
jgi:tRNA threonylcarbamoyladenosine biosynthesis protein TsaE